MGREVIIPYTPRSYQLEVHNSKARFRVCVFHRQAGKTTMAINELVKQALKTPNSVFWYLAPTYKMAKDIVWRPADGIFKYLPKELIKGRNNTELVIELVNGSIIQMKGADDPDSLRGARPRGVICDEYGDMKEELWDAVLRPIMTVHADAWCLFIGTPKGRNHFFNVYSNGTQKIGEWQSFLLKASESGVVAADRLEAARKEMPEAVYMQEFECEFLDSATSVFRDVDALITDGELKGINTRYQGGVDLAKYNDWTAIGMCNVHNLHVGIVDRFNRIDWSVQKPRIEARYHEYGQPVMYMDATGIGEPIVEDLMNAGLSVEPFKFTNNSRNALLSHLATLVDQRKVYFVKNEHTHELMNELKLFRYDVTSGGRVTMTVPEGKHDDTVMAVALSVWGIFDPTPSRDPLYNPSPIMKFEVNYD